MKSAPARHTLPPLQPLVQVARALSDAQRVRLLMALRGGALCVCQLLGLLPLAPSTVSRHLAVLHHAGLVRTTKRGKWVYYTLAGREASPLVRSALVWLRASAAATREVAADQQRLAKVNATARSALCKRYYREQRSNEHVPRQRS